MQITVVVKFIQKISLMVFVFFIMYTCIKIMQFDKGHMEKFTANETSLEID